MHENVGTANEASSSPEWVMSNKEMRYDIKPHLPEERWQAICYLAFLLDVSHPKRVAEMAFTAIPPNHLRLGGGLFIGWMCWPSIEGGRTT
ncbi:hypothetical protein RRG08_035541 [Elysia crispata]|uniref:Uncharacterized protein n=1 Tax=Elysia crispata TaxID=231223 RepID=A0AAE0YNK2_9GAST|nr:hypothetical protein RRG08_035541 [Elysia crispata]